MIDYSATKLFTSILSRGLEKTLGFGSIGNS